MCTAVVGVVRGDDDDDDEEEEEEEKVEDDDDEEEEEEEGCFKAIAMTRWTLGATARGGAMVAIMVPQQLSRT